MTDSKAPAAGKLCEVCRRPFCPGASTDPGCHQIGYERLQRALAEAEKKFHAQRAKVQAAHLAFHETGLWHGPEEEFDPAAQVRIVAAALAEAEKRALRVFDAHEREMNSYLDRVRAAEERAASLEGALCGVLGIIDSEPRMSGLEMLAFCGSPVQRTRVMQQARAALSRAEPPQEDK